MRQGKANSSGKDEEVRKFAEEKSLASEIFFGPPNLKILSPSLLCKHRSVNVKNTKFDWTRTAMSPSLLLIPFRILGPTLLSPRDFGHYFLKEISDTTISRRFRRIIGPSLLFAGGFLDP